jgi:hypothetical protein
MPCPWLGIRSTRHAGPRQWRCARRGWRRAGEAAAPSWRRQSPMRPLPRLRVTTCKVVGGVMLWKWNIPTSRFFQGLFRYYRNTTSIPEFAITEKLRNITVRNVSPVLCKECDETTKMLRGGFSIRLVKFCLTNTD